MSDRIRDLLHEVADGVEPGDRLDAIRAAAADGERRTGRGWWAAGGVGLIAASVVTALALSTGGAPTSDPGPADSPSTPTSSETFITRCQRCSPHANDTTSTLAVYYVGDTPDGPRLYREFRQVLSENEPDPLSAAVSAAVGSAGDDTALAPLDPDYFVTWPTGTTAEARVVPLEDRIEINLTGRSGVALDMIQSGTSDAAALSLEALVRTAQGVVGERLPVRFLIDGDITAEVLGVPTSEELSAAPDLDVLAHVNISDPFSGQVVDNDEPFVVEGVGNSYEGNIVTRVQTFAGRDVIDPQPTIAGWLEDRLYPFQVTLDLSGVPPGDYTVISQTDDPSGEGRFHTDSRQITVVD